MIETIKKLTELLGSSKKKILIILAVSVFGACFEAIGVSMMIPLVSAIINPDIISENRFVSDVCLFLNIHKHQTFILFCILSTTAIFILKDTFLAVEYYFQTKLVYDNRKKTQDLIFRSYLRKPYEFFLTVKTGDVIRTVNDDIVNSYTMLMTLLSFYSEILLAFILLITVFLIDWFMALFISLILAITVIIINCSIKPVIQRKGHELWKANAEKNKWTIQTLYGIKEIKILNKENFFEEEFSKTSQKCSSANKWKSFLDIIPKYLIEVCCVCTALLAIAVMAIKMNINASRLVPTLGAFAMAAVKLMPIANRIVNSYSSIVFSASSLDNVVNLIKTLKNEESSQSEETGKRVLTKGIELKNINYRYPNRNEYVLHNTTMEVPVGKSVGIVGPSGSGKTTVANILMGLLKPESGEVLFDDEKLSENYHGWLKNIGYIPQSIFIMDDTIKRNICFGNTENTELIRSVLKQAQMDDFVRNLPNGLDTNIGERGLNLSGGQIQRIGIARALYTNPDILVFDEATSSLDNTTEQALMESIAALHGSKTIIIIAHRLQTISKCDLVYQVEKGKIVKLRKNPVC